VGLIHDYAAIGDRASVSEVSWSESPLTTDLEAVKATDHKNVVPALSQRLM
jgi:hypothetical protein